MRIPYISLLAAGALSLGGCAYGDLGLGLGYGDPYYGYGYGYGPYGGYGTYPGYYGGFSYGYPYGGFGYNMPYYGWYDDYYYPGSGYYVYDVHRQPHVMTTTQRRYWARRSPALRASTSTRVQPNWSGFSRRSATERQSARQDREAAREQRRIEAQQRRRNNPSY